MPSVAILLIITIIVGYLVFMYFMLSDFNKWKTCNTFSLRFNPNNEKYFIVGTTYRDYPITNWFGLIKYYKERSKAIIVVERLNGNH